MLIAELFFLFSAAILILRFATFDKKDKVFVYADLFSLVLMVFAFYFFVYSPVGSTNTISVATNLTSLGNVITTTTATVTTPHILVTSTGIIMAYAFIGFYGVFTSILMLYDFVMAARKEQGMP